MLHMKLVRVEEIIIERAHRSGRSKRTANGDNLPRPIHVRFLNLSDKDYVIRRAPKSLTLPLPSLLVLTPYTKGVGGTPAISKTVAP